MTRNGKRCKHDDKNDRLREVMMPEMMTRKFHKGNNNNDNDRLREVMTTVIKVETSETSKELYRPETLM